MPQSSTLARIVVRSLALLLLLGPLGASRAAATPRMDSARTIGSLTVFADDRLPSLYYFAPPELEIASLPEGRPDFRFLETRYVGSATSADRGMIRHKSLITFRVRLPQVPADELAAAARALGTPAKRAELRPFPIRRLSTALVYAAIGAGASGAASGGGDSSPPDEPVALPEGRFEAGSASAESGGAAYWRERVYALGLDSLTAQAFRAALERGQVLLSLGYAFLGEAVGQGEDGAQLHGSPSLVRGLRQSIASKDGSGDADSSGANRLHVLRAGALGIGLDPTLWPDLMRRVDLNDRAPPGYAALDVYCYDFNNAVRPDLAEKRVEIDAEGIGGRRVAVQTYFKSDQPDLFASSVRFPVAVRLDRPYRYRIHEVKRNGASRVGRWHEVVRWSRILDVTSAPKEEGVRSVLGP